MRLMERLAGVFKPASTKKSLGEETAFTAAEQARPPFQGNHAFGLDPRRLAGIIAAADRGSTQPWFELAEEIEELYGHYAAVLSKRKRQVCQLPMTVVAASDNPDGERHADFLRRWLDIDVIQDALFDVCDGIGKGFSAHEIIWDTQPGSFRPRELIYKPQRFFEISYVDGNTLWLRDGKGFLELAEHKFLIHRHRAKSGNLVRSGLTRSIAFLWMFQAFTLRDWAIFTQAYGMPIRLGRYGPEASESDKLTLAKAVYAIAGDIAAIIPKSMEIEFIKDADRAAGQALYEKRADWLDRTVSKVVLGGTAGTDAINGGHAVGKEHRSAEQDVERFDARLLSVTIARQLAMPMIGFTFGEQVSYPRVMIGQEEQIPLKDLIAGVADLGPLGLRVRADELRDRLGLTKPEGDDDVVGAVQAGAGEAPKPPVNPGSSDAELNSGLLGGLRALVSLHSAGQAETRGDDPDRLVAAMTAHLAAEAADALGNMTDQVRAAVEAASDMRDLKRRLAHLQLNHADFTEAMAKGMALAEIVGRASVMAQLGKRSA